MRSVVPRLLPVLLLPALSLASPASAQVRHHSKEGYSILPPDGWRLFSGVLSEEELSVLPEGIRRNYDPSKVDVMFIHLGEEPGKSRFNDTLNVVVQTGSLNIDDRFLERMRGVLADAYGRDFPQFRMESFERTEIAGHPATSMRARYGLPVRSKQADGDAEEGGTLLPVVMHQFIVAGRERYLVVTCTFEAMRAETVAPICRRSVDSVRFDTAPASEEAPATPVGPDEGGGEPAATVRKAASKAPARGAKEGKDADPVDRP